MLEDIDQETFTDDSIITDLRNIHYGLFQIFREYNITYRDMKRMIVNFKSYSNYDYPFEKILCEILKFESPLNFREIVNYVKKYYKFSDDQILKNLLQDLINKIKENSDSSYKFNISYEQVSKNISTLIKNNTIQYNIISY